MSLASDSWLVPLGTYLNKLHPVPLCQTRAELHEWCMYETAVETQSPSQQTEPVCDNTSPIGQTERKKDHKSVREQERKIKVMEMSMVLTVVIYQGQIKTAPHTMMSPFSSSAGSIVTISRLLPEPCRSLQKT